MECKENGVINELVLDKIFRLTLKYSRMVMTGQKDFRADLGKLFGRRTGTNFI
jgi:hypothetical protein